MDFENTFVVLTYFSGKITEVIPCLTARYVGVYNRLYHTYNLKELSASAENCVGIFSFGVGGKNRDWLRAV